VRAIVAEVHDKAFVLHAVQDPTPAVDVAEKNPNNVHGV
jgi:hypothetical protein